MDELEFEGAGETFVKGIWRFEAGGVGFCSVKLGGCAEFLNTDSSLPTLTS